MPRWLLSLACCLAPLTGVRAQEFTPPPDEEQPPAANAQQPPEAEPPAPEVSIEDARINFNSIVEAFVAKMSPEGFWPLRAKKTGRLRHLQLVSVDAKKVVPAGEGQFKGPAVLRDILEKRNFDAEFYVDLSGSEWRVSGMKILSPKAAGKPAKKSAAPAP